MRFQRRADVFDDARLLLCSQRLGWNHIRIVSGPIPDADFGVAADYILETDRLARGRVEERLALVGGGPLRSADVILAASFRAVGPATCVHKSRDKGLLLLG